MLKECQYTTNLLKVTENAVGDFFPPEFILFGLEQLMALGSNVAVFQLSL